MDSGGSMVAKLKRFCLTGNLSGRLSACLSLQFIGAGAAGGRSLLPLESGHSVLPPSSLMHFEGGWLRGVGLRLSFGDRSLGVSSASINIDVGGRRGAGRHFLWTFLSFTLERLRPSRPCSAESLGRRALVPLTSSHRSAVFAAVGQGRL